MIDVAMRNNETFARSVKIIATGFDLPLSGRFLLQLRREKCPDKVEFEFSTENKRAQLILSDAQSGISVLALLATAGDVGGLHGFYVADLIYSDDREQRSFGDLQFVVKPGVSRPSSPPSVGYDDLSAFWPITDIACADPPTTLSLCSRIYSGAHAAVFGASLSVNLGTRATPELF